MVNVQVHQVSLSHVTALLAALIWIVYQNPVDNGHDHVPLSPVLAPQTHGKTSRHNRLKI
ncbi:unnamed protein product, partial [Trichogramma brassicae]